MEEGGLGFAAGDLVTATVRRSCGHCHACAEGAPDACGTGDYSEHGITRLHGFAAELAVVPAEHLIAVPEALRDVGVLAEPASICARAVRHALVVGNRQPWAPARAMVFGVGAIGMLCTYLLRLEGLDVWTSALEPAGSEKAQLVEASGARYVPSAGPPAHDGPGLRHRHRRRRERRPLAQRPPAPAPGRRRAPPRRRRARARRHRARAGDRARHDPRQPRDPRERERERDRRRAAMTALEAARARWPGALERCVGLRVGLGDFADAFAFGGVKATLTL